VRNSVLEEEAALFHEIPPLREAAAGDGFREWRRGSSSWNRGIV
jgi:hypothetical protein